MPLFKCVKPTTYKGRQAGVGVSVRVNDKDAVMFDKNICWEKIQVKNGDVDPEAQRLSLLEHAKSLGLKPNARLGAVKLRKLISDAETEATDSII